MRESIPPPMRGIPSLVEIDRLLRKHQSIGVLVGSIGLRLYQQKFLETKVGKDVDVLIINQDKYSFPKQWEGGVDWWVSSKSLHRPCNGTQVGLLFSYTLQQGIFVPPGLYLLPPGLLKASAQWEIAQGLTFSSEKEILLDGLINGPPLVELPVLNLTFLKCNEFKFNSPIEEHYKNDLL